ncbi:hypothetical protein Tco_0812771 [Tanacetum coccineum]
MDETQQFWDPLGFFLEAKGQTDENLCEGLDGNESQLSPHKHLDGWSAFQHAVSGIWKCTMPRRPTFSQLDESRHRADLAEPWGRSKVPHSKSSGQGAFRAGDQGKHTEYAPGKQTAEKGRNMLQSLRALTSSPKRLAAGTTILE